MPGRRFVRAIQDAFLQILSLAELTLDVLDGDRGIIHQNSNRQRQTAQGHDVDGFAERTQDQQRRQNRIAEWKWR